MSRLLFDFPPRPGAPPARRIFRDPVEVVRAVEIEEVGPALERIERSTREEGLWAAGFLTYEAAPAFDPAFRVRPGARGPLLWFGLYEGPGDSGAFPSMRSPDHRAGPAPPEASGELGVPRSHSRAAGPHDPFAPWRLDISREDFAHRVDRIQRAIEAGESYQVNFTARMRARLDSGSTGDAEAPRPAPEDPGPRPADENQGPHAHRHLYEALRRSQGEGYHALLELDDQTIVSASPELFFQLRGREVTVRPMKGTRPRGRWLEEDEALARELRSSEKEQAENRMIVDLLRNDLGRVAETGSVRVPRIFDVERYRTVLQMTSTVSGTLPPGAGFVQVLRALFPSGSVTGAPKIQTMKLIAELESSPREVYCGAIGYVEGGSGDAIFNVPIRTLRVDRESKTAVYGTGSGITWGSRAEEEYREIRAKARILSERWPDFDLLESLRLEEGTFRRMERHLARMRDSAAYFGRPFPGDEVRSALAAVARDHPRGCRKARLTLSETGAVQVSVERLTDESGDLSIDPLASGPSEDRESDPADAGPGARPVALAATPVDSSDRFLFHKTTHRVVYDSYRANHRDAFDVLLWNEKREITEFTYGNVMVDLDGRRVTPPRSCGLLAGCFREELLDEGVVEEERIEIDDLHRADRIWLTNSVRGWVPVRLP